MSIENSVIQFAKELENEIKNANLDEHLKQWNLNYLNNHLNRYIHEIKLINKYFKQGKILEIGSIPCHITYILYKFKFPFTGVDINPDRCKHLTDKYDIKIIKADIETAPLPFEDNEFDLILFNEIFEHLRIDPIFTLKEINRVLKPGGTMILSTPNLYSLLKIIKYLRGQSFNNAYLEFEKLYTIGHMGHIREYTENEVKTFLTNTGFKVLDVEYKIYSKTRSNLINLGYKMFRKLRPNMVFISTKDNF